MATAAPSGAGRSRVGARPATVRALDRRATHDLTRNPREEAEMDIVLVIGRVLFGVLFVSSGLMAHLGAGGRQGREYARSLGAPAPDLLVPLSGVTIIVGGALVALGLWADLGAILIAGFLIGITPIMHAFWKIEDEQNRTIQLAMFMKNLSLLGAAIIVFWLYNQGQDVPASLSDALFDRI
jgi:putative oxidoreductase